MDETPVTPPGSPWPGYLPPAPPPPPAPSRRARRLWTAAAGVAAVAGVGVGAGALAAATTSSSTSSTDATGAPNANATTPGSSSASTSPSTPSPTNGGSSDGSGPRGRLHRPGGFGPFGGIGGIGGMGGPVVHGEFTIKGPNGYETLAERNGTVSSVTDTAGSTWTLVVKSADGSSGTFTVDSGTSVNGGEMGIGSVKAGDTVNVVAVVSGSTSTAKQVSDQTVLQANGQGWHAFGPGGPGPMGEAGTGNPGTGNPGTGNTGSSSST